MVKFSVEGREEKRRKLYSSLPPCLLFSNEEEDEEEEEEEGGGGKEPSEAHESSSKEAITVSIDPDVLDCPICCEPLAPPVFQCENGHIACSSCCTKIKNKCHSCSCPVGPIRCLALEKVIESIKISCPHASNGCRETVSYAQRHTHEETCIYASCYCPILDCAFEGSSQQLSQHFCSKHGDHATFFLYNLSFEVSLCESESFHVLHGDDGILFLLLNNRSVSVGNAVMVTCLGPNSLKGDFSYELIARRQGSSIRLEASVTTIKRWMGVFPSKDFLLIPRNFYDVPGKLILEICIRS